jgi:NADH dehydrogenase/NADH:ubiquinone oxidoreductase subunit G
LSEEIGITIDGQTVNIPAGSTILEAAKFAGIEIPVLCYFEHTTANGLCRLCAVEVEGAPGMQMACVSQAQADSVVYTRSPDIDRARKTILEMLDSTVDLSETPEVLELLEQYGAQPGRYSGGKKLEPPLIDDNSVFIRDYAKCVMCWRCVQVCAEDAQYAFAINFGGRGFDTTIATFFDKPIPATTCVFCGQCVGVCPSGALKAKREHLFEQGMRPEDIFAETKMRKKRRNKQ